MILVTGGAGFVGSHVAHALLQRGEKVVIVDEMNNFYDVSMKWSNIKNLQNKFADKLVGFIQGDVADMVLMDDVFIRYKPHTVVHMAARAGVRPSIENPFIYIHSNILGTTVLLELAKKYSVRSFVFASSSSVYGNSQNKCFRESDTTDEPISHYAATKKACELLAYTYSTLYHMNITGLRFFTVFGPKGRLDMAPMRFIDRISKGLEIEQYGDGTTARDYTYIDDIVDGVVRAMDRANGYQIFNLGNGRPCLLSDFISAIEKALGRKARIRVCPAQLGDVERTCADIGKAEKILGYCPRTSLEEGVRKTVEWHKLCEKNKN